MTFEDACEIATGRRPEPQCPEQAIRRQLRLIEAMDLDAVVTHHLHGISTAVDGGFTAGQQQDALVHATALIGIAGALKAHALDVVTAIPAKMEPPKDPFVDETKQDFFRHHSCWKCNSGENPCVSRSGVCEYPRARND